MANHCEIRTKKKVTESEIDAVIRPLLDRFQGALAVEKSKGDDSYGEVYWSISNPIFNGYEAVQFWIENEHHIEFRHGHAYPHFWFLEGVFRENLAQHFDGITIDEGDCVERTPSPDKFESFEIYLNTAFGGRDSYISIRKPIYLAYATHYDNDILRKLEVIDEFLLDV